MNKIRLDNKDFYYRVFYKNNKNMYLRVKEGVVIVTCNRRITKNQIEDFIKKNQFKIQEILISKQKQEPLYDKENLLIFDELLKINYHVNASKNSYLIKDYSIDINFKENYFDTKYIERIYQELLLDEMKKIYAEEKHNLEKHFDVSNITFKTQLMKSRFGSCIAKKRIIKLNTILARFSRNYTRVILIHELIHLKEQNHQKGFYQYIDTLIPNYKLVIKELNQRTRKYVI